MKVRRKKKRPQEAPGGQEDSAMNVATFLEHNRKSKPPPGAAKGRKKKPLEIALEDAEKRASTGDWEDAQIKTFVGLYALCHRLTYGVEAEDLSDAGAFQTAKRMAARALHVHFEDDKVELVEFVKWVWVREKTREEWAAREGKTRGRLNVRIQFSISMVTDYRVDLHRQKRRRRIRR